jgi:hypothetical protein
VTSGKSGLSGTGIGFLVIGASALLLIQGSPEPGTQSAARPPSLTPASLYTPEPPASPPLVQHAPAQPSGFQVYISGHRVPMRGAADDKAAILDRLDNGTRVTEVRRDAEFVLIRHPVTAREGWVSAKRLTLTEPAREQPQKKIEETIPPAAILSKALVIKALIAESIASAPGPCAGSYQRDRRGHMCGARSAHDRPGGYSPLCTEADITPAMIAAYRERRQASGN